MTVKELMAALSKFKEDLPVLLALDPHDNEFMEVDQMGASFFKYDGGVYRNTLKEAEGVRAVWLDVE